MAQTSEGFVIQLDGRSVKTPAKRSLAIRTQALADAVAEEWRAQGEDILPLTMPLTQMANSGADMDDTTRAQTHALLVEYADTDLLCYRSESRIQNSESSKNVLTTDNWQLATKHLWDPILAWAEQRYDVKFVTTTGIVPVAQPPETLKRMEALLAGESNFMFAGLSVLISRTGSFVLAYALKEGGVSVEDAIRAAQLDEQLQAEQWGKVDDAEERLAAQAADIRAGAQFVNLLSR